MNHLTTVADVRDLDRVYLDTIGGADYYELRQVVKVDNGKQAVIGRASDWPIIQANAKHADAVFLASRLAALLADSDYHVGELLARQVAYEDEVASLKAHIAALESALADTDPPRITPPEAAAAETAFTEVAAPLVAPDDGLIACDWPGCEDRVKPRGLGAHKKRAHGVAGQIGHKGAAPAPLSPPRRSGRGPQHPVLSPDLAEPPWRCEQCDTSTHTRSLSNPKRCMRCATDAIVTNGHLVAA